MVWVVFFRVLFARSAEVSDQVSLGWTTQMQAGWNRLTMRIELVVILDCLYGRQESPVVRNRALPLEVGHHPKESRRL